MNLQFFPSKRIALYMGRIFLIRCFAVLAMLVVILMTLDLLGESGKILAYPGNGDAELWRYVSLRLPQLIARFLPFSVLLGTLITLSTLNQHSEVISMKAAGISAHQIIAPLVVAALGIAVVSFAFNERIVTRATATLEDWDDVDFGPVPRDSGMKANVWVRHGDDLIFARTVRPSPAATILGDVTIYERSGETLEAIVTGRRGSPSGRAWRLENAERFDVAAGTSQRLPSIEFGAGLDPAQFALADADADKQDFRALQDSIRQLKTAGRATMALESGLWHKFSGPLSALLMPLLGAVAGFGLARTGQLFIRAVIGMALGFAYFVVDNFALALGNLGAYSPPLAAWAPFALFLLVGESVLIRTEE